MELLAHRRGVGKGLAGVRWFSEVDCAGKWLSGMGSSLSRTFGEHVLHGIVAVPLEVVGCGEDGCEGEVAEGGVFAGPWPVRIKQASSRKAVSRTAVVLDLDGRMSAVEGEATIGRCQCMGERGDPARWGLCQIWRAPTRG